MVDLTRSIDLTKPQTTEDLQKFLSPPEKPKDIFITLVDGTELKYPENTTPQEIEKDILENYSESIPKKKILTLKDNTKVEYDATDSAEEIEEDLEDKYPEIFEEPAAPDSGLFRGLSRGTDVLLQLGFSGLGTAAEAAGFDSAAEYFDYKAGQQRRQMMNKPLSVESFRKAEGMGEKFDYFKNILGETLPISGSVLAASIAGARLGSALGAPGLVGGALAGFATSALFGSGEVREEIKDELRKQGLPESDTGSTKEQLAGGAAIGALDTIGVLTVFGPVFKKFAAKFGVDAMADQASEVTGIDKKVIKEASKAVGYSRSIGKQAGLGAIVEAPTEAAQEYISAVATDAAFGRDPRSLAEMKDHLIDAAIAGGLVGGAFGGVSGAAGAYFENSQIKKDALALSEEDRRKKAEQSANKEPAPLQENQTITYIEDDGNEETAIVRKITRNTDDDTILSVGVVKNNGDGEVEFIDPERIKNELSTDPNASYKSAEVRSAENRLLKAQEDQKSSAEINKLVDELNAAKIKQNLNIGQLTNRPVDNVGEAAAVLINAGLYNEAQAAKSEEEQITAANNRRNLEHQQRTAEAKKQLREKQVKKQLQTGQLAEAIFELSTTKPSFTLADIQTHLGLNEPQYVNQIRDALANLGRDNIIKFAEEQEVGKKQLSYQKDKLTTGSNFKNIQVDQLTTEGAKNYIKNIDKNLSEVAKTQDDTVIKNVVKNQIYKKYTNPILSNAFDMIKKQVFLDNKVKGKSIIRLLNDENFQKLDGKTQREILKEVENTNLDSQVAVQTDPGTQATIEDTFKTFLKDKNNKPLNVTQREIDAGLAIREFTKKNKRTGKSETTAVQYPLVEGNIVKDKNNLPVPAGEKRRVVPVEGGNIITNKGDGLNLDVQTMKLVHTLAPKEQRNPNDPKNFRIYEVFRLPDKATAHERIMLVNRGGADNKTFEIIESSDFGKDGRSSPEATKYIQKLRAKAKKLNEKLIQQILADQYAGGGDREFGQFQDAPEVQKIFKFKTVEYDPNLASEKEIIKIMKQIGKSFGLKSTELSALSMGGELSVSFANPVGYIGPEEGLQGWFTRHYPIEGKESPAIRAAAKNGATVIHEFTHALDNFLGVRYGKNWGAFMKESDAAFKNFIKNNLTLGVSTGMVKRLQSVMQQNKSFFKEMLTHGTLKPSNSLNLEAKKAYETLYNFMMESEYYQESIKVDTLLLKKGRPATKAGFYYTMPTEVFARTVEKVISSKLGYLTREHDRGYYPQGDEFTTATTLVENLFASFKKDELVNKETGQTYTIFKARSAAKPSFNLAIQKSVKELQDLTRKLLGTDRLIQFIPTPLKTNEVTDKNRLDETGNYVRGVTFGDMAQVSLAYDNADFTTIHEAFHIAEEIGLINVNDIQFLNTQNKEIIKLIKEAQRLEHPTLSKLNANILFENSHEIRAYGVEAFKYIQDIRKADAGITGTLKNIMNKVVNFFKKIKNWFAGNGFNSFEDIMNNFLYGRYAKSSEQLVEIYKDRPSDIKNPLFAFGAGISTQSQDTQAGIKGVESAIKFEEKVKNIQKPEDMDDATREDIVNQIVDLSNTELQISHPSSLADKYPNTFGILYSQLESQRQLTSKIEDRAVELTLPFFKLDVNSSTYKKIAKILEVTDYYKGLLPRKTPGGGLILKGMPTIPGRENSQINFQETVELSPAEAKIYEGVREALDGIYDQTMLAFMSALGVKFPGKTFSFQEAISILSEQARKKRLEGKIEEARLREHGIDLLNQASKDRHAGYFPRSRSGVEGYIVKKGGKTVHFEVIPEKIIRFGKRPRVDETKSAAVLNSVKEKFPESRGFKVEKLNLASSPDSAKEEFLKVLSVAEKMQYYTTSPEVKDEVKGILDSIKEKATQKSFLKFVRTRSEENITGYINERNEAAYHREALLNYIQSGATFAGSVQSAPAINGTMANLEKLQRDKGAVGENMIKYMKDQIEYVRSPYDEFRIAKFTSFFAYMGFNASSAILNLTQIPQVTMPIIQSLGGYIKGAVAMTKALKDAAKLSSLTATDQYFIDSKKIINSKTLTADEKEMLLDFFQKSINRPLRNIDAGVRFNSEVESALRQKGLAEGMISFLRKMSLLSGGMFGYMEQINRVSSALVFYRMTRDNADFKSNLNLYKNMTKYKNIKELTPKMAAEIGVFESQFLMGKENRPMIARGTGALGSFGPLATQFQTFVFQFMGIFFRNMRQSAEFMGKNPSAAERKLAGKVFANMVINVTLFAGVFGLPLADILKELIKDLSRALTKQEIDIEVELREALQEILEGTFDSKTAAFVNDSINRGLVRNISFGDMSTRAGFGNPIGYDAMNGKLLAITGPFGNLVASSVKDLTTSLQEGKYGKAMVSVAPLGWRNILYEPYQMATKGVQTASGRTIVPKEEVGLSDLIIKGIGFTPTRIAKERELTRVKKYITTRDKSLREFYTTKLVDNLAMAYYARESGELSKAKKYLQKYKDLMKEIATDNKDRPMEEKIIIQPSTIRNRFYVEIRGINSNASLRYTPKLDRKKSIEARKLFFGE